MGYGGTFVFVGDNVRVRAKGHGFGRGCIAKVLKLGKPGPGSICEIEIVSPGRPVPSGGGWKIGNRLDLCCGWLEGIRM